MINFTLEHIRQSWRAFINKNRSHRCLQNLGMMKFIVTLNDNHIYNQYHLYSASEYSNVSLCKDRSQVYICLSCNNVFIYH